MKDRKPEALTPQAGRYSPLRLFVIAVAFIAAAPVFWHRTQIHSAPVTASYENADLYQEVYPIYHYGFGRIREGQIPLWNSKQLCGTPFLANPATGVLQPLNFVFALLPKEQAMAVHGFVCLTLMGWFFVLFARSLGAGYVGAFAGAVAYAFCGASAAAVSRPALIDTLVWTPMLFWSLHAYVRTWRFRAAVAAGLSGALLLLSGATAMCVAISAVAFLYVLLPALLPSRFDRPGILRRIEGMVLIGIVAIALAAAQWAPALAWLFSLHEPMRALWDGGMPGLAPMSFSEVFSQLLAPKPGPLPRLAYMGPLALLAIPAAMFHREARREALFFLCAVPVLTLAGMRGTGVIPFDFPASHALFAALFSLAVLVALGFDRLLHTTRHGHSPGSPSDGGWKAIWAPALATLLCAGILFYTLPAGPRGRIIVFLVLLLPIILFRVRFVSALCGILLATVLFVDLATASATLYHHPFEDAPLCYQRYIQSIRKAEDQALGARMLVSSQPTDVALPARLAMVSPVLYDAGGQDPLTRSQATWWRRLGPEKPPAEEAGNNASGVFPEAAAPNLLNYMAVRAILAGPGSPMYDGAWKQPGPPLDEVKDGDPARLYINAKGFARAWWVPSWRSVEGVAAAADLLASAGFDGTRECAIDLDSNSYAQAAAMVPGPRGADTPAPMPPPEVTCTLEEETPERVLVRVSAPQPGITVMADSYDPGWRATLDGAPCAILRVNGLFRGVATPAGPHEIRLEYRPVSFIAGMAVSLSALGILALSGLIAFFRN